MTTITQLATRALGDDFAATELDNAKRYVRQGLSKIYREAATARGQVTGQLNLLANTENVTFGAPIPGLRVGRVFHADTGQELAPMEFDDLLNLIKRTTVPVGRPAYYAVGNAGAVPTIAEAQTFYVYPRPSKNFTLWVTGHGTQPNVADGDTVLLDEVYEDAPRYFARAELFADKEDDFAMHDSWMTKFEQKCRELRADLQSGPQRHRQVPGTWSGLSGAPSFVRPDGTVT